MAIKIPEYQESVGLTNPGAPSVPNLTAPPPSAFGTESAAELGQTGKIIEQFGGQLAEHILQRQEMAQRAQVIAKSTDFKEGLQDDMTSTEIDPETNAPKGVFARHGLQAHGATQDFDVQYKERAASKDFLGDPTLSLYQRQQMAEKLAEDYPRYRELVSKHEADQVRQGQDAIVMGSLSQKEQQAPLFAGDPKAMISDITQAHQDLYANLKSNGEDGEFPKKADAFSKSYVLSAMGESLENNPTRSQHMLDFLNKIDPMFASPQTKNEIQKIIDNAQDNFKTKSKKTLDIHNDVNEAALAGKYANGELTQLDLDREKPGLSLDFYQVASASLKEKPGTVGTPAQQDSRYVSLMQDYVKINEGDTDQRTNALMKFRKELIADKTKLKEKDFNQMLGWTDPNFVQKQIAPKVGFIDAGIKFIKDHYANFVQGPGANIGKSIADFVNGAANPATKDEDIPAIAQAAVKGDTYRDNPSLMGQKDLSNNVVNQKTGIKQVTGVQSTLKADRTISGTPAFKPGDEREKDGITYVRQEDGKWLPKR